MGCRVDGSGGSRGRAGGGRRGGRRPGSAGLSGSREELRRRVDTLEGGYAQFLSFAARGLSAGASESVRDDLGRFAAALDGLAEVFRTIVREEETASPDAYEAFFEVVERDATSAARAVRLVLAQPGISSQLVDNLNASMHVRAVLTDLFLVDEALRPGAAATVPAP